MKEFEKYLKRLNSKGYKVFRTYKREYGKRLICEKKQRLRASRRILIHHFLKRKPTIDDLDGFVRDFESFLDNFGSDFNIDGGILVTHGKYNKRRFRMILDRLEDDISERLRIVSLKEEKPTLATESYEESKLPKAIALSQKKKAMFIDVVGNRCCFPHCRETLSLDVHHIVPVKEGGINEETNLVVLCTNHHRLADRGAISKERLMRYNVARKTKRF